MYTSVWAKYIPIIRIILKKSLASEQVLALNVPDFKRAGMTRKSGYKFLIIIKNGKLSNVIVDFPIAAGLASAMLEDKVIKELCLTNEFHISLNTSFELTIKHIPHLETAENSSPQEEDSAVNANTNH